MLGIMVLSTMFLLMICHINYYKDIRHPVTMFLIVWFLVLFVNLTVINYIPVSDESIFFVFIMIIIFLLSALISSKIKIKLKYSIQKVNVVSNLFYVTFFINLFATLLILKEYYLSGLSITEFIASLRAVQMYPDEYVYPGLLSNFFIMRIIKNNYIFNYILMLLLLILTSSKKLVLMNLFLRLIFATLMGSRWQGVIDIISVSFIIIDRSQISIKTIVKFLSLFIFFFMLAGILRSEKGFSFDYFIMYIFGGLPAFSILYDNPTGIYLPKTFIYIEQIVGLYKEQFFNIVADSIWLNNEIKTNTYTMFGVLFKYFGGFGTAIYLFFLGGIFSFLYNHKTKNITFAMIYYITLPSVFLSVFTEVFLSLAPIYLRLFFILLLLKFLFKAKHVN